MLTFNSVAVMINGDSSWSNENIFMFYYTEL
jgi:hypothetical protein